MVLIHLKKGDRAQFLHEASHVLKIEQVLTQLVFLNNQKVRIEKLIDCVQGLVQFGPLRPEALRGLTSPESLEPAYEMLRPDEKEFMSVTRSGQIKNPDPTGYRTGLAPSLESAAKLNEIVEQAKKIVANTNPDLKKHLLVDEVKEIIMLFKGAVMIAYPGYYGLPDWEPVLLLLEDKLDLLSVYPDCEFIPEKKATLWWAKKELMAGQLLSTYVGKNEKTKIIVKLMEKGKGAPLSEPVIDKETHTKMLGFYHKKQEEMKKLEEDNEDDYLNSVWANNQNLKNQLVNGGKDIKWKNGLV